MNGWEGWFPHWPTVFVSVGSLFVMSFVKEFAEQLVARIFRKKKDEVDD